MSSSQSAYAFIRRMAGDQAFFAQVMANPEAALGASGISDPADQQVVRQVIASARAATAPPDVIAQFQKQQAETMSQYARSQQSTMSTIEELKLSLRKTLEQIDQGFRSTKLMYQVTFYLGVFLILVGVATAVLNGSQLIATVFGGLGIADFIAFFITKPPEDLEKSRADLAQLQVALFTWFNDNYNWNTLLNQEGPKGKVDLAFLNKVSDAMYEDTRRTMADIEAYCKFAIKGNDKPSKEEEGIPGAAPETSEQPQAGS